MAASFKNFGRQNHRLRDKGGTHVGVCHRKSYDQRCGSVRGLQTDVLPTMAKYGARLVARGVPIVLEGEWPRERLIIAEFPSMEQAREWWASPG